MQYIRNFSIIAHIDHGKSTLSDRLIEECKGVETREISEQMLDSMDIERERGITIKAQTVRLQYIAQNGHQYYLNIIDTPGHVDFSYEVSRSLAACEGSLLIVDASQGVEAQTLANVYKAMDNNHEIIPILNKIDLPAAEPQRVKEQIEEVIGIDTENTIEISAKTGLGIKDVLEAIVTYLPHPEGDKKAPLQALLIDSWYDVYLGVIILIRVKNGIITKNTKIKMMSNHITHQIEKIGIFTPKKEYVEKLSAGEIGFITSGIKKVTDCKIGDTITENNRPCEVPLQGFKATRPTVFCGLFPIDSGEYQVLKDSLEKLHLNDSSFTFDIESSGALGHGFRCGFLGMLHLEIVQERLEREFNLSIITTAPSVIYKIHTNKGKTLELHNPADMPDPTHIDYTEEPWVTTTIMTPSDYVGAVLQLCTNKRGEQSDLNYSGTKSIIIYTLPLAEVIFDFYDNLKSLTRGYASCDWEILEYRRTQLSKMNILVNGDALDALSCLIYKHNAEARGREICKRLKDIIPRQQYKIALQAAIGGKIIARETIQPYRKDVTEKLYGGDVTRKMKLLDKQKKGKKRMHSVGKVTIPKNAFIEALKIRN